MLIEMVNVVMQDELVKCPCLWAEAVGEDTEHIVLHVAYDLGFGICFQQDLQSLLPREARVLPSLYCFFLRAFLS